MWGIFGSLCQLRSSMQLTMRNDLQGRIYLYTTVIFSDFLSSTLDGNIRFHDQQISCISSRPFWLPFLVSAWRIPVAPFGVASAYNLVALGYNGIDGSITANIDITGRIAAATTVSGSMTLGSSLNADPWGSIATYGLVATTGLGGGTQVNMNGGGKVYAPGSNGNINFNEPASQSGRVTSGSSGIDFSSLRTTLDA